MPRLNEDIGATEHLANLDQMGIWSRKCGSNDVLPRKEVPFDGLRHLGEICPHALPNGRE